VRAAKAATAKPIPAAFKAEPNALTPILALFILSV